MVSWCYFEEPVQSTSLVSDANARCQPITARGKMPKLFLNRSRARADACTTAIRCILGEEDWLNWKRVGDIEFLQDGFQVSHEQRAPRPSATPILPVGTIYLKD